MPTSSRFSLEIDRRRLTRILLGIAGLLVLFHVASVMLGERSWQMTRLFNLGLETNVPTWFSSALLALGALAAYGCSQRSPLGRRSIWQMMALGLLFMSCDEVAMIHENLTRVLKQNFFQGSFVSTLDLSWWPIFLGPFILAGVFWLGWNLRRCLRGRAEVGRLLALGVALFFGGCMGVEILTDFFGPDPVSLNFPAQARLILEESLEMLGSITLFSALLLYCQEKTS